MEPDNQNRDTFTFTVKRSYLYVVLALAVGFGGGFGLAKVFLDSETAPEALTQASEPTDLQEEAAAPASTPTPASTPAPTPLPEIVQVSIEGRPYIGPEDAKVTIAEFTDYQCPFCARHFRQTIPELLSQYGDSVRYVVLNFPTTTIHPFAQKAAEAAECAYAQGSFWEFHDLMFENQRALGVDSLKGYAADLGLDTGAFDTCLDSGAMEEQVLKDYQDGRNYGVRGTPSFFINGEKMVGAQPFNSFKIAIDKALEE